MIRGLLCSGSLSIQVLRLDVQGLRFQVSCPSSELGFCGQSLLLDILVVMLLLIPCLIWCCEGWVAGNARKHTCRRKPENLGGKWQNPESVGSSLHHTKLEGFYSCHLLLQENLRDKSCCWIMGNITDITMFSPHHCIHEVSSFFRDTVVLKH